MLLAGAQTCARLFNTSEGGKKWLVNRLSTPTANGQIYSIGDWATINVMPCLTEVLRLQLELPMNDSHVTGQSRLKCLDIYRPN